MWRKGMACRWCIANLITGWIMREIKIRRLTLGSLSNGVGQNYQSLNCYVWNSYGPVVMGRPSRPSGDHWQKGPWKSQSIITPDLIELGIDAGPRLVSITGVGWPLDPGLSAIRVHPFRSYLMPFSDLTHIRWPDYSAASCRPVAAIFWQCAWHKRRTGHRKLIVTGIVIFSWTLTGA